MTGQRDALTGLGSRQDLDDDLALLGERVKRYGHRYCLALIDVDLFAAYNLTNGRRAGDVVLGAIAAGLKAQARGGDALYHLEGDKFLCVFAEQSVLSGTQAVERFRSTVTAMAISHPAGPAGVLSISAGVAVLDPADTRSPREVMDEADLALFWAKKRGRNRVEYIDIREPTDA